MDLFSCRSAWIRNETNHWMYDKDGLISHNVCKNLIHVLFFSVKEQRSAGLDLANLAASSVDNKFALVAEGG